MRNKLSWLLFLSITIQTAEANAAAIKGVNYDPVHSFDFAKAVGLDDKQGMITAINKDLDKLAELQNNGFQNIRYLKTFFTSYSSLGSDPNKRVTVNIADVVNDWNIKHPANALKLALGVYEFRVGVDSCQDESTCRAWTLVQVNDAIKSANQYPGLIDRIIVGNEDLSDNNIKNRVVQDIKKLKSAINVPPIKIGTAQVADDIYQMFASQKNVDVKNAADFVGTNVYPYWGGVSYGDAPYTNSPAKQNFEKYWSNINLIRGNYEVIETEEGWPSDGDPIGGAMPNPAFAHDYFYYWYYRDEKIAPVSYYFALFDKAPGLGTESHWGIFSADRNASMLGTSFNSNDYSKPLADKHVLVTFKNLIGKAGGLPRVAALTACTEDWDPITQLQGTCYPIDGYYHTGDIAKLKQKQFMIDATGATYASLMVLFYGDGRDAPRLCYINKASLQAMTNQTQVILQWKKDDGAVPCQIQ